MRLFCMSALALSLAALVATPALAQRQRGGQGFGGRGGFGGGAAALLRSEEVQKELKLTEQQQEKLKEALQDVMAKHGDELQKLRDRDLDREERQRIMRTLSEASSKAVAGVLNKEQMKRLKQIELQQRGLEAFREEEVQKALNLTDEQKEKIRTIAEDVQKERQELFRDGRGGDFQEAFKKMTALRREGMERATAVLTDEQKQTWKELTGDPVEIRFRGFGGGRPGGGRPGGRPPRDP